MPSSAPKKSPLIDLFSGLPDSSTFEVQKQPWGQGAFVSFKKGSIAAGSIGGLKHKGNKHWMGLNRRSAFWFQPFFGKNASDQAPKGETILVLWKSGGSFNLALPLSNGSARASFATATDSFQLDLFQDLGTEPQDATPLLYLARGKDPFALIRGAVAAIADRFKTFRLREDKDLPEFVDYLGWCTWDAFYKDVSEEKVLSGLKTFTKGGTVPGFLIIDDGWQDVDNQRMQSFRSNEKFPEGLAPVVEKSKKAGVKLVGVWHALQGYWQGTDAKGELAEDYKIKVSRKREEVFIGWPEQYDAASRDMVTIADVHRFYQDYYASLRAQGVDMTKVDNQGMLEFFCGKIQPRVAGYRAYQQALQGAAQTHFKGNLIHCMCNTTDIAFHYSSTVVWRNSDDFYPDKPIKKQGMHIHHNGLNAFFTHTFALPDWDMFQSYHESGEYHAASRAISGGPIYVSDEPGKQNFELIRKLCFEDGSAIRSEVPAIPTEDCLLVDCCSEPIPFKLQTYNAGIGVLGIFHVTAPAEEGERAPTVSGSWSPGDLPELEGADLAVYSYKTGALSTMQADNASEITLDELGFDILTVSPIERFSEDSKHAVAPIGLTNKMNPSACVSAWGWSEADTFGVELLWGGTLTLYSSSEPKQVLADGSPIEFSYDSETRAVSAEIPAEAPVYVELGL